MQKLSVHYADGSEKTTGKETPQMVKFNIDGPGGERVVKVEVGMKTLPQAIKVIRPLAPFLVF